MANEGQEMRENIEELAWAIIRQARWDYIHAKEKEDPRHRREWTKKEVQEFIHSRWCETLTQGRVERAYLMEEFEKERKEYRERLKHKRPGTYAPRVQVAPKKQGRPRKDATK